MRRTPAPPTCLRCLHCRKCPHCTPRTTTGGDLDALGVFTGRPGVVVASDAVKVKVPPSHKSLSPSKAMVGALPTVSTSVTSWKSPHNRRHRTRSPSGPWPETSIDSASPPLDHWYEAKPSGAVTVTRSPGQNDVHRLLPSHLWCMALPTHCGTGRFPDWQSPFQTAWPLHHRLVHGFVDSKPKTTTKPIP